MSLKDKIGKLDEKAIAAGIGITIAGGIALMAGYLTIGAWLFSNKKEERITITQRDLHIPSNYGPVTERHLQLDESGARLQIYTQMDDGKIKYELYHIELGQRINWKREEPPIQEAAPPVQVEQLEQKIEAKINEEIEKKINEKIKGMTLVELELPSQPKTEKVIQQPTIENQQEQDWFYKRWGRTVYGAGKEVGKKAYNYWTDW